MIWRCAAAIYAAAVVVTACAASREHPVAGPATTLRAHDGCDTRASRPHGERPPTLIEHRKSTTSVVGTTVNTLDRAGRLVTTEIDLDGDGRVEQTVHRDYDAAGRLIAIRQPDRTLRFVRDRNGRIMRRETEGRSGMVEQTEVAYDDHDRVVREIDDLDDLRYTYDQAGCQVREQRYRVGDDVPFIDLVARCDEHGRRVSREGDDGSGPIRETWRYDEHGHMVQDELFRDGVLVLDTRVSYDTAGRRLAEDYRDVKGTMTGRRSWSYNADGDVLSDQVDDLDDGSWIRDTYVYDERGDRCPTTARYQVTRLHHGTFWAASLAAST